MFDLNLYSYLLSDNRDRGMLRICTEQISDDGRIQGEFESLLKLFIRTSDDAMRLCTSNTRLIASEPYSDWVMFEIFFGDTSGGYSCMERVSEGHIFRHRTSTREDATVHPPKGTGTFLAASTIAWFVLSTARTCAWESLPEAMEFHAKCLQRFECRFKSLGIRPVVRGYDFFLEKTTLSLEPF
jgi:hypothetical protein